MREDWPHLDMLADKNAMLGTDSRLKLIEAVLFDVRRRVDELNESIATAGERLHFVEGNLQQQRHFGPLQSGPPLTGPLQSPRTGKKQFPAPPVENTDSLQEDVRFLHHSLEEDRLKCEQEINSVRRLLEQEIISVREHLDGNEESSKRFTESQRVQQSALDSCLQRLENCEDMKASIQKLTDAEVEIRGKLTASVQKLTYAELEIRGHLEEVQHSIEVCLAKQQAESEERGVLIDARPIDGRKPARDVDPLLDGRMAKLSHDVSGVSERLKTLELSVQGSALDRQDQSTADETLVKDVRRMQLAIATISRSVSKVAKDVFDMRANEHITRNPAPLSLGSTRAQGGMLGPKSGSVPEAHGSSAVDVEQLPDKSHVQATSAPSLSIRSPATRSPYIRPAGTWLRPDRASAKEDLASNVSTISMPPRNTDTETSSTPCSPPCDSPVQMVQARTTLNRITTARGAVLSAVPEYPRSATFGAKTVAHSPLNRPFLPSDRFSHRPRLSLQPQRIAHP